MPLMLAWFFQQRAGHLQWPLVCDRGDLTGGAGRSLIAPRNSPNLGHRRGLVLGDPPGRLLRNLLWAGPVRGRKALAGLVRSGRGQLAGGVGR